jgi:hypothetical protein
VERFKELEQNLLRASSGFTQDEMRKMAEFIEALVRSHQGSRTLARAVSTDVESSLFFGLPHF